MSRGDAGVARSVGGHKLHVVGEGILHAALLGLFKVADLRGTGDVALESDGLIDIVLAGLARATCWRRGHERALVPDRIGVNGSQMLPTSLPSNFTEQPMSVRARRQFLRSGAALAGTPLVLQACSSASGEDSYEANVRRIWRPAEVVTGDSLAIRRELVRYATLAPSSHNTQCWRFRIEETAITLLPDLTRRTPAVDPDDHHLHISLGCATENLVQAALAHGLKALPQSDAGAGTEVRIAFEPTQAVASPLFQAIPTRQCTRGEFDGKPLTADELKLLEHAGTGEGVRMILLTEKSALERVLEYVVQGNSAQMNDSAFVAELKQWIRFGSAEAVRSGDGLYSAAFGNPSVPRWLGSMLFGMLYTEDSENEKYAKDIRSSAGIAVFVSQAEGNTAQTVNWIEVGRCYERFALQAAALGIRNAFLNQPVEVMALRPQFATYLSVGDHRPDLVVRFGRGPELPKSLRRPLAAVLV